MATTSNQQQQEEQQEKGEEMGALGLSPYNNLHEQPVSPSTEFLF